ncbi:hypothetical protein KVH17_09220 [Streptomyces olivaceus]|uniref:hypothetical protein n=1 Tax=Streptomyces TaxID=1883 RepID=UPI001CC93128|nr:MULTISPECIES: hypothetical protein [Streptomyces]MBZ6199900.1 hypothetical protein [Streptomyces olivaceus]MBZ6304805.1 hypothetical protein [Streptomyces olivaceus]MBZ6317931.1 hypothetical protein [Streptomyces olivaceus]MCC2266502.1 hypothetical protein [Streptomyces sp. CT1-17]
MNPGSVLSALPGAASVSGLASAWRWSPNPMFTFTAALSTDGRHNLQVNVRGPYGEGFVTALLAHARAHGGTFVEQRRPLVAVGGFQYDGAAFDTVGVAAPEVHGYHAAENPELSAVTYAVFPAYASEISGRENEEEAWGRFRKMLQPNRLDRTEVPFVKMRYDNTRTQSMSKGDARGFAPLETLQRELGLLDGAPGSFVEWENRHGAVWRADSNSDGLELAHDGTRDTVDTDQLQATARTSVQ